MSLRVWLPLNGNLNNNGTYNVTVANTNAAVNTSGKVGSCYRFNKNAYLDISKEAVSTIDSGECSFCLWLNINSFNAAYDTYVQFGLGTTPWVAYTMGLLRNNANSNLVFVISNGSTTTTTSFTTPNVTLGQWFHIACVYKAGHCLIYINGVLHADNTTTLVPNFSAVTKICLGGLPSAYKTDTFINDFRIYDHALSAKEVKDIAKGLLLHLPLNDLVGNENLVKGSTKGAGLSQTTYNLQDYNFSKALVSGTTYTITCKMNMSDEKKSFAVYHSGGSLICGSWITSVGNGIYTWSFTATSQMASQTAGDGYGYARVYVSNNNGTQGSTALSGTASVEWIKIEEGSTPTGFIPNSADTLYNTLGLNLTTVRDVSGYKNNGTMTATKPTVDTNSARYGVAMTFANGVYISIPMPSITGFANSYTFSWWGKCTAYEGKMYWGFSNGNKLNLYGTGGVYCWNTGDGAGNKFTGVTFVSEIDGNWHHFAVTGDGTTTKLYIDGVFKANATTYKAITGTTLILNGWDTSNSYKFNGQLSDFRIYATALSADDILDLYNKPVSIDNTGKVHAIEYSEV